MVDGYQAGREALARNRAELVQRPRSSGRMDWGMERGKGDLLFSFQGRAGSLR